MSNEKLLRNLKTFDPELWEILQTSLTRQLNTLSLIPTTNAASPFASYLRGSTLGNDFLDHHAAEHCSKLEKMAIRRACALFRAEHAIVRIGNPAVASRVVLQALAHPEDTILSFNLRKQEHCTGSQMQYRFVKFGVEPDTLTIDFGKVRALEKGLKKAGCHLLCSPTENHLVLLHLPESQSGLQAEENLKQAGLLVKPEVLMTADDSISYPILRLSSLDATTRSLQEEDMEKVGQTLGDFLHSPQDSAAQKAVSKVIRKMVENLPLFSEDWLPELESMSEDDADIAMQAMVHWRI